MAHIQRPVQRDENPPGNQHRSKTAGMGGLQGPAKRGTVFADGGVRVQNARPSIRRR